VGNKTDLAERRAIQVEVAKEYADVLGIPFTETSARTTDNVDKAFHMLAEEVIRFHTQGWQPPGTQIGLTPKRPPPGGKPSKCILLWFPSPRLSLPSFPPYPHSFTLHVITIARSSRLPFPIWFVDFFFYIIPLFFLAYLHLPLCLPNSSSFPARFLRPFPTALPMLRHQYVIIHPFWRTFWHPATSSWFPRPPEERSSFPAVS